MNLESEIDRQVEILSSGTAEIIPESELRLKLKNSLVSRVPLRVKMGIDPTSPDIHLGHMVVYRKIRQFQDLGHRALLIIGDYTARIGDPTGRNSERPPLTEEEVSRNSRTYQEQIFRIADPDKTDILYQSSWFNGISLQEILKAASLFSTARMLSHETFRKRLDEGNRLSLHELLYPLLQAWDSHIVKADVELGGTDQKFNILCGRDFQKQRSQPPQTVILMPLLSGSDGRKMSKSLNNHIAVQSGPMEKFGSIMAINDELIPEYFRHAVGASESLIEEVHSRMEKENPMELKMELAGQIVSFYHSRKEAAECTEEFRRVFRNRDMPSEIPVTNRQPGEMHIASFLKEEGICSSGSEARRLILQGGLKVDGKKLTDPDGILNLERGQQMLIKAGKRRFLKINCG